MLENKKNNKKDDKPKRKRIVIGNNNNAEPIGDFDDDDEERESFGPKQSRGLPASSNTGEIDDEDEDDEEKPKRKRVVIDNNENNTPHPRLKINQSSRKLYSPEQPRKPSSNNDYEVVPQNSNNEEEEEPLLNSTNTNNNVPAPPPNNNNNVPAPPPNNNAPAPPLPPSNDDDEKNPKIRLGVSKMNLSLKDINKGLKDSVIREKPFGKDINKDKKFAQLKELENTYKNQDKVDFEDAKKQIKEFLDDFDEKGTLKTALRGYNTKLDKSHWTLYLEELFTALEHIGNPLQKKTSLRGTKLTAKVGGKRKSTRYTRKLRR